MTGLHGGPDPEWAREIASPEADWYEEFANAAHLIHPGWTPYIDLTPEETAACEQYADARATRPQEER